MTNEEKIHVKRIWSTIIKKNSNRVIMNQTNKEGWMSLLKHTFTTAFSSHAFPYKSEVMYVRSNAVFDIKARGNV